MRTLVVSLALVLALTGLAYGELENVQVGGEIRIRGNYVNGNLVSPGPPEMRWPAFQLPGRAIGGPFAAGGNNGLGILSPVAWDNQNDSFKMIEQRTKLNIKADFTNDVAAFIELDSYDVWGEDFRSNYVTGADFVTGTADDVEIYQAYIEADNMFGLPLRARIGRQEIRLGSEFLVGSKDDAFFFYGRSFDGVRLTYSADAFTVDAFATKLAEMSPAEEDGDVDFYGIYASCSALENITFDAYWLLLRDAGSINDTNYGWLGEWMEDLVDVDDYDVTNLHTVGLRAAGVVGALDFEAEIAYQFGDAGRIGNGFKPFTYGDDGADFGEWAGHLTVGYTIDMPWQPRPFITAMYYGGEDNRDLSFLDWLNPFDRPQASVSFNRLFSNKTMCGFIDPFHDLSNVWMARVGVVAHPTETLTAVFCVQYFDALEEFDAPASFRLGRYNIPIAPGLSFWTDETDSQFDFETTLQLIYNYSEDLSFFFQWSHMFVNDGLSDGNFALGNGLVFSGGSSDDDADYVCLETRLKF